MILISFKMINNKCKGKEMKKQQKSTFHFSEWDILDISTAAAAGETNYKHK